MKFRPYSFGKDNTNIRELRKATNYIGTEARQKTPIKVLVIPSIVVPPQNHIRQVNGNMVYLHGLRLAHPITEEDMFEISVFIGAYYY